MGFLGAQALSSPALHVRQSPAVAVTGQSLRAPPRQHLGPRSPPPKASDQSTEYQGWEETFT